MVEHARRFPNWVIAGFVCTLVVLLAGGSWFYVAQRNRLRDEAEADLTAIARLKIAQIVQWRAERLGDAEVVSESPYVTRAFAQFISGNPASPAGELLTALRSVQERYRYSDALLVDAAGRVRATLRGTAVELRHEELRDLNVALQKRRPILTELFAGSGDDPVMMDAVAPIFDGAANGNAPMGGIILRIAANDFLFPLIQSWPTPSWSAETLLVRADGDSVLYLNELRHQKDTALRLRIPLSRTDLPAAQAVGGKEGIAYGLDYRGTPVVSALGAVPGSAWFIVAKDDEAEVFAAWRFRSVLILSALLALAAAGAGAFGMIWQRNEKARSRALFSAEEAQRASEERYRITLMSVGDGVIATDADGTVSLMNPVAEELTGWTQKEALGRPLEEVFRIVREETREPVENPLRRVSREGAVAGLANHTLLISRRGVERTIADSGAPVRDEKGRMVGMVLVFRDVSEDRMHRAEREVTLELLSILNTQNRSAELVRSVTRLLQSWTGCAAVGVRLKEGEDYPYHETRGFPPEFVSEENFLCERDLTGTPVRDSEGNPILECMCGNVLRGRSDPSKPFFTARGSFWTNSTTRLLVSATEADRLAGTPNRCNARGYESVALIRLKGGNETVGLLQMNDHAEGRFTPELISFLESAADQIGIALAQRRAEAALRASEEHYRLLFENMLNGFAVCEMVFENGRAVDFVYREVNDAFSALTGLRNVVGKRVSEIIPGVQESDPQLFEIYGRVVQTGIPERFETHVQSLQMWFSISVYRQREGIFVAIFDVITERKKAEANRLLLATAIDQAAEMILITDSEGKIQYVNPAFEAVTGFSYVDAVGRTPRILKSGDHDAAFYNGLWSTISAGKTWKGRLRNRRKDGTLYSEDAIISPVRDDSGTIVNFVAAMHDSTHELLLEEQLLQAQKMESVGRLAGGVAHDFNNMLQVIGSNAELSLKHLTPSQPLFKYINQIQAAARRSAELTGQLLAFARKQTVSPRLVNLADAVTSTLKMLRRLIGEDIDLSWNPAETAGVVKVDPTQLDQILANLAVNARDAIEGVGRLTIETGRAVFDEAYCADHPGYVPGEYVMLAVSDNGHGMDKAVMSHLFEPFFTTKATGKGTGLGLATVYGIVRQNNGFINVYSEPGMGTTFRMYLPRVRDGEAPVVLENLENHVPGGTETLLVVEDEEAILELSRQSLEDLGYRVLTSQSPEDAIRIAEGHTETIHLLITDVVMPHMNGRELARRLSAINVGLKCLYTSGYTADVIAHHGVLEEGVSFIAKPYTLAALASKVRSVLDGDPGKPG